MRGFRLIEVLEIFPPRGSLCWMIYWKRPFSAWSSLGSSCRVTPFSPRLPSLFILQPSVANVLSCPSACFALSLSHARGARTSSRLPLSAEPLTSSALLYRCPSTRCSIHWRLQHLMSYSPVRELGAGACSDEGERKSCQRCTKSSGSGCVRELCVSTVCSIALWGPCVCPPAPQVLYGNADWL